jgi:hypothetical protein
VNQDQGYKQAMDVTARITAPARNEDEWLRRKSSAFVIRIGTLTYQKNRNQGGGEEGNGVGGVEGSEPQLAKLA